MRIGRNVLGNKLATGFFGAVSFISAIYAVLTDFWAAAVEMPLPFIAWTVSMVCFGAAIGCLISARVDLTGKRVRETAREEVDNALSDDDLFASVDGVRASFVNAMEAAGVARKQDLPVISLAPMDDIDAMFDKSDTSASS